MGIDVITHESHVKACVNQNGDPGDVVNNIIHLGNNNIWYNSQNWPLIRQPEIKSNVRTNK